VVEKDIKFDKKSNVRSILIILNNLVNFSMKHVKNSFFAFALVSLVLVFSCGTDKDEETETPKDVTIAALTGDWTLNTSESDFANLTETPTATVTVSSAGISITDGTLGDYVSQISYSVSDEGALVPSGATLASSEITLDGDVTVGINDGLDKITVSFTTQAARVSGVGSFKLVFDKAS